MPERVCISDRSHSGSLSRLIIVTDEAVQKLTPEENSALEAFVAVLSEQDPKRAK